MAQVAPYVERGKKEEDENPRDGRKWWRDRSYRNDGGGAMYNVIKGLGEEFYGL